MWKKEGDKKSAKNSRHAHGDLNPNPPRGTPHAHDARGPALQPFASQSPACSKPPMPKHEKAIVASERSEGERELAWGGERGVACVFLHVCVCVLAGVLV